MSFTVSKLPDNDKFAAHMKQMEMNFAPEVIGGFIDIALTAVDDQASSKAPVDRGILRDSIQHYMIAVMAGECIVAAPYAIPVEYGYMSRGGKRIQGRNFFRPAASAGFKLLVDMLRKFVGENVRGAAPTPAHRAGIGGERPHKFLYKRSSSTGKSTYYYSPGVKTRSTIPLFRGPGKSQPSFGRVRGGRSPRRF